jgi:hypothetical protein
MKEIIFFLLAVFFIALVLTFVYINDQARRTDKVYHYPVTLHHEKTSERF